jgi:membrane protease YdiL (CAAX protease family)
MNNVPTRWRTLARVLLFFVDCAAVLAGTAPLAPRGSGATAGLFIGTVASLGAFVLTFLFVRWEGLRLSDVGASLDRQSLLRLALGFLIGLFIVALQTLMMWVAGHVRWELSEEVNVAATTIPLIAYLSLSAREELAFHGYPLQRLVPSFGLWPGQLLVALVFAAEHRVGGSSWGHALVGAGAGSLLFGMAAIASRGLALPIGLHAAWNLGDWMRGGKGWNGPWKAVVAEGCEECTQLVGIVSYLLVVFSATLLFWLWYRFVEKGNRELGVGATERLQ